MLEIFEDGFVYIGDDTRADFPLEKTSEVVVEMYYYSEWIKKQELNKGKLLSQGIN